MSLTTSVILVMSVLTAATLLVEILNRSRPGHHTLSNVKVIIKSWWIIAIVVMSSMLIGPYGLLLLFFSLSLLVLNEYLKKSPYGGERKFFIFLPIFLVLLFQYAAIVKHQDHLFYVLIPLAILVVAPLIIILTKSVQTLPAAFGVIAGLLLLNYYLSHIPALAFTHKIIWRRPDQPMLAILILIFLTECNDVFQFLCGKLFGRRKIVPQISPNKTEMGFIGGLICTSVAAAFLTPLALQITRPQGALLGFMISVLGIFGDLFFSAVKRHLGLKDFSQALPGHGGFIDRLDSLIFTAPVYFHLLIYLKGNP